MTNIDIEQKLEEITRALTHELVQLTPEIMEHIDFKITATDDGGADYELLHTHPEAKYVNIVESNVPPLVQHYISLIPKYVDSWASSTFAFKMNENGDWDCSMDIERDDS